MKPLFQAIMDHLFSRDELPIKAPGQIRMENLMKSKGLDPRVCGSGEEFKQWAKEKAQSSQSNN